MAFPIAPGYGNLPNGNFTPVIYSKNVLKRFRKVAVATQITNTDYTGEIANYGDTVRIIKESPVTVGPLVRGQTLVSTDLIDEDISLLIDKANYFQFQVDDIEKKQSHINWQPMQQDRAAYDLRDTFDTEVLSYMATNAGVTTGLGTTTAAIVVKPVAAAGQFTPLALLARASRLFDQNNIPVEDRAVVASPHFWELMQSEDSSLMQSYVMGDGKSPIGDGLYNGKVINKVIRNFNCYQSNNLPTGGSSSDGSAATDYSSIIFCHKSAVATAAQIADTEMFRSPVAFADIVRGKHLYGRKVLRTEALGVAYWNAGS